MFIASNVAIDASRGGSTNKKLLVWQLYIISNVYSFCSGLQNQKIDLVIVAPLDAASMAKQFP